MNLVTVRYTVRDARLDEHLALCHGVYDELLATTPEGLRYGTFRDGADFVHLAALDAPDALQQVEAFRRFQTGLDDRLAAPLVRVELREVGSYRLLGQPE